ncbi:MAG: pyridoxal-dependent decarboxylase, partial [Myxococcales bacterium]|nr:pyridoxal-dependent decarboxylase [Myxococcales bacterium]
AEIAAIARQHEIWFHVDGAYGAPAAVLPEWAEAFRGLEQADSIALDPHKWLYSPLEAGCALVRDPQRLRDAFSFRPAYYEFEEAEAEAGANYYEYGPQNSRGFRALKVWLALRQVGRDGYVQMIRDDIALARRLHAAVEAHPELEAGTQHLSITTFRYVPPELRRSAGEANATLNELNRALVTRLQERGEVFVSNAVIDDRYLLRACIVNFRTTRRDIDALPDIVAREGRALHAQLRPRE